MRFLVVFFCTFMLSLSCGKNDPPPAECIIPLVAPLQPYSDPVWHPNGQLLGFNHTPLAGIGTNGTPPCVWYSYGGKADSTGFYLINKDGSGFKRVTNFKLSAPAWSPDGNWLAFSLGPNIYKMPFNGSTFDTAQMLKLTTTGGNFFPNWTANSDTIYFDSNVGSPSGTSYYAIWKMSNYGNSKLQISASGTYGRQPFVGSNSLIYYSYYSGLQPEIFSMNKDGSNQMQVTYNGRNGNRNTPKFYQGNLIYNDNGTLKIISATGVETALVNPSVTYDISSVGDIVFSSMNYNISIYNKQIGTLWIMNVDGSNKRQLTFNNF